MPIVNGHQAETGCYVDGHWGQYGPDRLAEQAEAFGWPSTEDDDPRWWRTVAQALDDGLPPPEGTPDGIDAAGAWERHSESADDIERWLNDNTAVMCKNCGHPLVYDHGIDEYRHHPLGHSDDSRDCPAENQNGERADPQHYVWHWSDGEFFLSPICDDPEVCDDDTCAHWE